MCQVQADGSQMQDAQLVAVQSEQDSSQPQLVAVQGAQTQAQASIVTTQPQVVASGDAPQMVNQDGQPLQVSTKNAK